MSSNFLSKQEMHYLPGDLTEPLQQHDSRELLEKITNSGTRHGHKCRASSSISNKDLRLYNPDVVNLKHTMEYTKNFDEKSLRNNHSLDTLRPYTSGSDKSNLSSIKPNMTPAIFNFQMAKKMAQENLEHQPLPDAILDMSFRKLQVQGAANPGIALKNGYYASGVGCKNYKAGPTQLTKLRVYRPKTCGVVPLNLLKSNMEKYDSSCIKKDRLGAMDLAIYWDCKTKDPRDEPKPSVHIDGTNFSAGPAIFTMVKPPEKIPVGDINRPVGIFANTLGEVEFFDRDVIRQSMQNKKQNSLGRPCTCKMIESKKQHKHTLLDDEIRRRRYNSSPNLSVTENLQTTNHAYDEYIQKQNNPKMKHTTDIRVFDKNFENHRIGEENVRGTKKNKKTNRMCRHFHESYVRTPVKEEYKAAFKAGIPLSNSSGTCTSFDSGCSSISTLGDYRNNNSSNNNKMIVVPKPKPPYTKKNYIIDTLNAPFATYTDTKNQTGYPDHWRLASIYQHAYKPIENRKRSLLKTVFQ